MTSGKVTAANTQLADPTVAQPIVETAAGALAAMTAAGITLNPVETTFLQNMPGDVWSKLQQAILDAYGADKTPELQPLQAGEYDVSSSEVGDKVLITLSGPIPTAAR